MHALAVLALAIQALIAPAAPTLDWMEKVSTEGEHNAFTDLILWDGYYYICYRHGETHNSMDGEIHVQRSLDMRAWEPCGVIRTMGDDRDPHFAATDDTLYLYFGVWDLTHSDDTSPPDRKAVRSHCAKTQDGTTWSKVQAVYDSGWWLWRVRVLDGVFYTAAYTAVRPTPDKRVTQLLRSDDGLEWELVSTVTDQNMAGEADMWLEANGAMSLLTRTRNNAILYRSDEPRQTWTATQLDALVHSPVMAQWNDRRFIAGRDKHEGKTVTKLWELDGDRLAELMVLPSGGDTSYAGLIVDPDADTNGAPALYVSWYSQDAPDRDRAANPASADVYVAHITIAD